MARYDKEKVIGSGTFGHVWLVKSKLSRQSYVLKEINMNVLSESEQQQALKEAEILGKCKHFNIIRYKEAVFDTDKNILSIVMEYAEGGDLHGAIKRQKGVPFKEHRVISWFTQICLALQYIHYQNILHRDLKSQNIFLGRNKIIKVGDFGIARVVHGPDDLANTAVGTPYYLSPEVFQRNPYNYKSDIWALGCVLFEMVTLQHAFKADDFIHLVSLVRNGIRGKLPRDCNPFIQGLIDNLLKVDPRERPSTTEILANPVLQPYLSEYMSNQNKKCNLSPMDGTNETNSRRSSANDIYKIKEHPIKRKNSLSSVNPKAPKQRTTPLLGNTVKVKTEQFVSLPRSSSNIQKAPFISADKSGKELTYKISKVRFTFLGSKENLDLTRSCDAYVMAESAHGGNDKLSKFTKSEDLSFNGHHDFGYHTEEDGFCNNDLFDTDNIKSPLENMNLIDLRENVSRRDSECLNACNKEILHSPDGYHHSPCRHTQCHHCMLNTLWNNRIRGVGAVIDTEERSRLKNKLLLVYREKLFSKVYHYLASDWEGNDAATSKSKFQRIMNALNYEQVQSLPLMMQLIQLDQLVKSRLN